MSIFDPNAPSATDTTPVDLGSLFGVSQNVGGATVRIKGATGRDTSVPLSTYNKLGKEDQIALGPQAEVSDKLERVLAGLYSMDDDSLQNLQQQLFLGHFYDDSYYSKSSNKVPQYRTADDDTLKALTRAATQAARSGKLLTDVIGHAISANKDTFGAAGKSGSKRLPLVTEVTNPDDIKTIIQKTAPSIIGRNPSPDEINHLIGAFQSLQRSNQQSKYNMQGTQNDDGTYSVGTGGNLTAAPDLGAFVTQQLQAAHPDEYHAMNQANALQTFFSLLQSSQSPFTNASGVGS